MSSVARRSPLDYLARLPSRVGWRSGERVVDTADERIPTWRRWSLAAALLILPLVVYWPTIVAEFGFRDDYSILREAIEEPGKVFRVCAMQARPIYGWLLEATFGFARDIPGLWLIRALSAATLGVVCATTFLLLRWLGWERWTAALAAAVVAVLPSSQVSVSWAVAWPLHVSLLLSLAGFFCAEKAFTRRRGSDPQPPQRVAITGAARLLAFGRVRAPSLAWWLLAVLFVAGSALTYQPNALFYFSAVAAALGMRRRWGSRSGVVWLVRHAATVGVGLVAAFTVMIVAFAESWVPMSRRVAFEHDWLGKLEWFLATPLRNALALVALNQDGGAPLVSWCAAVVAVVIVAGVSRAWFTRGARHLLWWTAAFATVILGSFAVNLVVADRWPAYRVLLPLTATVLVVFVVALLTLGGRLAARATLLALLVPGIWLARIQSFELFARPQNLELGLLERGARRIEPNAHPSVFVLTPFDEDHVGPRVFLDEFGSLSSNSYWTPKEMLKLIMWQRYPRERDVSHEYSFACGPALPARSKYDVVIDLHRLRDMRTR